MHLARKRGALLAHGHNTNSQSNLPALGHKLAYKTNRDGVAERVADPAVHKSLEVDLALIGAYDELLRDVELTRVNTAKPQDAQPRYLLQTVPGIGPILRLVLLYAIQQIARCPRGQDFAFDGRLVKGAPEAAGKRSGPSGTHIGNAHLTWAFSEAAILGWRDHPAGQKVLASWEKKHRQGNAVTIVAHNLARAVDDMVKRHTAFARHPFLHAYGRGVGELNAYLDSHRISRFLNARHGVKPCVFARPGADRSLSLSHTYDETPTPAPADTAKLVNGLGVLLLTRACPARGNVSR